MTTVTRYNLDTPNGYTETLDFIRRVIVDAYTYGNGYVPATADEQFEATMLDDAIYNNTSFDEEELLIRADQMDEFRELWTREFERFRDMHPDMVS